MQLSMLEAALATGTLSATILLLFIHLRKRRGQWVLSFFFFAITLFVAFSQTNSFSMLLILVGLIGLFHFLIFLPIVTMIQEQTEEHKMGRVMSIVSLAASGLEPLSYACISLLMTAGYSIRALLLASGIGCFMMAVLILIKGKRFRNME